MLRLAGDSSKLDKLDFVDILIDMNFDISGITNNEFVKSVNASDYLPDGVYFVGENDEVLLTLKFESLKTSNITFSKEQVDLRGLDSNYKAEIEDSSFTIKVSGDESQLSLLTQDSVKPYIDLSGLSAGKYNLIMQFDGLDNVILTSNISVKLKIENKG